MVVTVRIPAHLKKYVEYIPEEDLERVLIGALEAKISAKEPQKLTENQVDLSALVSLLSKGQTQILNNEVKEEKPKQEESAEKEIIKSFKNTVTVVDTSYDEDEDLDDFMDLMK